MRQNFSDDPRPRRSMRAHRAPATPGCAHRGASGWPPPQRHGGRARAAHRDVAPRLAAKAPTPRSACRGAERPALHHAQHRHAIFDQGDVDGELAVALDELAGAVERIDQPQASIGAWPRECRRPSSDSTGTCGVECRQAVDDDAVRGQIGRGQRRVVVLQLDLESCA
jgi:hypothetical protein